MKTVEEKDLINLIYCKIGGCLRNQDSDYAVRIVKDLMEQYAKEKVEEVFYDIDEVLSDRFMARQAEKTEYSNSMKNSHINRELSTINYIEKTINKAVKPKYQ